MNKANEDITKYFKMDRFKFEYIDEGYEARKVE